MTSHIIETTSEEGGNRIINISDFNQYKLPEEAFYGDLRATTEFEMFGNIGDGSSATVLKAKDTKHNRIVAMKYLKNASLGKDLKRETFREITILKTLRHEHVIELYEVSIAPELNNLCLILEYCPHSLDKLIDSYTKDIPVTQAKCIAKQLFRGLDYIHKNFIIHRDLTTTNCLISSEGQLKISDFGLSRKYNLNCRNFCPLTPGVVTLWYRAPEILLEAPSYGREVDLWSAGCILAEVLLREPLLKGESELDQISLTIDLIGSPNPKVWPGYTKCGIPKSIRLKSSPFNKIQERFQKFDGTSVTEIISGLLIYNPEKRLSAENCAQHEWIEKAPFPDSKIDISCLTK